MSGFKPLSPGSALGHISHPVAIITVNDGKNFNGMTAAWVTQISIKPPIMCVSISPKRHTWAMLENVEYFGVSMLGKDQEEESNFFGSKSGRKMDKFKHMAIEPFMAAHGVPLIPGSVAGFVCRKTHQVEQGDHYALFGEVVEAWKGTDNVPLNFFRSKYRTW
ncbi:MAG: flavin reductase family protein [Candidatus Thermoplasmatota archaeon]|nr:flavin reductase [Euryarchaeota archaeon]MBU4032051.1 flavin reductase family protein [Candidatus Thermoplasmatota archaeon]MBU4070681.1 flavin reductase family protein [Candidatus Thermoplasmatota archaeon]MBU4143717.1 flavin reductase family protein [Candidatus Thermoplasmatota archaeon]MBU4592400.1 flavin reductase family protein [Candidatus Thermoplasmatota archaeon]